MTLPPRQENLSEIDAPGKRLWRSFIHSADSIAFLSCVRHCSRCHPPSIAVNKTKSPLSCVYIQRREIKLKANKYTTFLNTNKAGQGLESNRGSWNCLSWRQCCVMPQEGGFRAGAEAAGQHCVWVAWNASGFQHSPSPMPTGARLQLGSASRCLCRQEWSTISSQGVWWNLGGRERGKGEETQNMGTVA